MTQPGVTVSLKNILPCLENKTSQGRMMVVEHPLPQGGGPEREKKVVSTFGIVSRGLVVLVTLFAVIIMVLVTCLVFGGYFVYWGK